MPTNDVYGIYSAAITTANCNAFLQMLSTYWKGRDNTLHLAICSGGGDIFAGVMIYNTLRAMPLTLHTYNIGSVHSVANVMFLAGDKRFCSPSASFGYHSAGFNADPTTRIDSRLLAEWSAKVKVDNDRLSAILLDRTDLDKTAIANLLHEEQFMPAAWALEHGVVHEVGTFEIPDGAPRMIYTD